MATRQLPGVYVSLYDLSQLPEGAQSLNVGYVVKAERGKVNDWSLVTNPTDFLTKYTFSGQPKQTDDPTFYSILKVLAQTNSMYIVRAANNPLYGGVIIKKSKDYGRVVAVSKDDETITFEGEEVPEIDEVIMITGTNLVDGYYIVKAVNDGGNVITVTGDILEDYGKIADIKAITEETKTFTFDGDLTSTLKANDKFSVRCTKEVNDEVKVDVENFTVATVTYNAETEITTLIVKEKVEFPEDYTVEEAIYRVGQVEGSELLRAPVAPLASQKIADIYSVDLEENAFILNGNVAAKITDGDKITVKGSQEAGYANNDGDFTVISADFDLSANKTVVVVKEALVEAGGGAVYYNSLKNPEAFKGSFSDEDLMLITGIDAGAYNGKEAFTILSALDNADQMIYYKGAKGIFPEPCTFDTMQLGVVNTETNEVVETYTFSRDPEAKAIDGSNLFVDDIVSGSAYIKVINNPANVDVPNSTLSGTPIQASGGSDGEAVSATDLTAALNVFKDKTIPVSIIGNGCSEQAESELFQKAMMELAVERKDLVAFLNSRKKDETATLPSTRAQNIVTWKKSNIGSTSFYGCMYAPHVKTPDVFNSRDIEIGADAVAIAGWLDVINNLNYPYAYAGPRNGLVTGVTTDWKIGDTSGEAELLNDASINYVAYDGKVGRYYMQTQNTLQVANSAMRNLGAVFNVLDIKENLAINLKEYIGLPITDDLRRDILDACNDYLSPMVGSRFYNYSFQDITTATDIDQDTLRYWAGFAITRYATRIYLAINIVRSGFDFSILQSA